MPRHHHQQPRPVEIGADAKLIASHWGLAASEVVKASVGAFKPAVYRLGEDYFCSPNEGEALPEEALFAKGWQLIATYEGRSIHRARG